MFENLQVYQKAVTFADDVCCLTRDLSRGYFFVPTTWHTRASGVTPQPYFV